MSFIDFRCNEFTQMLYQHVAPCPKYDAAFEKLLTNPDPNTEFYEFNKRHAELYAYLTEHTGRVMWDSFSDSSTIFIESFASDSCRKSEICWKRSMCRTHWRWRVNMVCRCHHGLKSYFPTKWRTWKQDCTIWIRKRRICCASELVHCSPMSTNKWSKRKMTNRVGPSHFIPLTTLRLWTYWMRWMYWIKRNRHPTIVQR